METTITMGAIEMMQHELMAQLEPLMDSAGTDMVLLAIARVCNEKAEHIRINYPEAKHSASAWDTLASCLDKLADATSL